MARHKGTIREAFESIREQGWKRVVFEGPNNRGYIFDIDDEEGIAEFLRTNGGFHVAFEPHSYWSDNVVCIDCEHILGGPPSSDSLL